ncbi:MAG: hypothetical protein ACTS9Y_00310 [Methylophilus sp.]|uniref:hypothetical protein n=1 Tax=Methylophilus sp. TaxID=29541 RepID=UPI003F9ED619
MSDKVKSAMRQAFEAWHAKENMHLYTYEIDPDTGWYKYGKVQDDWRVWGCGQEMLMTQLEAHAKPVVFEWVQTGKNCDEPILKCEVFGHIGDVYLSNDNKLWTMKVDSGGERGFESMQAAKARVEEIIRHMINNRIKYASEVVSITMVESESLALLGKFQAALHEINQLRGSTTNFGVARAIACKALGIEHTDSSEPASVLP